MGRPNRESDSGGCLPARRQRYILHISMISCMLAAGSACSGNNPLIQRENRIRNLRPNERYEEGP